MSVPTNLQRKSLPPQYPNLRLENSENQEIQQTKINKIADPALQYFQKCKSSANNQYNDDLYEDIEEPDLEKNYAIINNSKKSLAAWLTTLLFASLVTVLLVIVLI